MDGERAEGSTGCTAVVVVLECPMQGSTVHTVLHAALARALAAIRLARGNAEELIHMSAVLVSQSNTMQPTLRTLPFTTDMQGFLLRLSHVLSGGSSAGPSGGAHGLRVADALACASRLLNMDHSTVKHCIVIPFSKIIDTGPRFDGAGTLQGVVESLRAQEVQLSVMTGRSCSSAVRLFERVRVRADEDRDETILQHRGVTLYLRSIALSIAELETAYVELSQPSTTTTMAATAAIGTRLRVLVIAIVKQGVMMIALLLFIDVMPAQFPFL